MTTITPAVLDQFSFDSVSEPTVDNELGQAEFLELMMAQLKHQDPMQPADNGEFLGQMAQFSTVTGIEEMAASLETLTETFASGQTLQSSQLVGQEVLIENSAIELVDGETASGSFELDASSGDVKLDITDAAGELVRQINLGEHSAGRHSFTWDGLDSNGEQAVPGKYTANITTRQGEIYESVTVLNSRVIDSVEFGAGGETTLNTKQGDKLTIADIREIRNAS